MHPPLHFYKLKVELLHNKTALKPFIRIIAKCLHTLKIIEEYAQEKNNYMITHTDSSYDSAASMQNLNFPSNQLKVTLPKYSESGTENNKQTKTWLLSVKSWPQQTTTK